MFSIVEQSRIEGGDAEITGGIIDRFHMADTVQYLRGEDEISSS